MCLPAISIFIPVYKESNELGDTLDSLFVQNVETDIFVTVDEATTCFIEKSKQYQDKVKFIFNKERTGKSNALNEAVKYSSSQNLLFLDSDILVSKDPDFLKKILTALQHSDVVDVKKQVIKGKSFLSKMAYYEYFTFNVSSWIANRFIHSCPAINGAAFAIKRETFEKVGGFHKVIAEDLDIATRAFLNNSRFAYTVDVDVKNVVHSTWQKWFKQRQRWAIGQALWLKAWFVELAKKFVKKPQVFLPSLFFLYPSVIVLLLSVFVPSIWVYNSVLLFSLFLSVRFNFILPIFFVSLAMSDILKTVLVSLASFGVTAVMFYGFSRKLGFKNFKLHELFVYYFFYSTLWMIIIFIGYIQVLLLGKKTVPNWKT
ncbi:MAG: glycosyltransferase family 2 protein [Nitrososphaerota archaeon]|jgi:cellulose synthase/poly-beta-1,6-N-acetylglucosamine synthase-like glycosyltransferase|nr:glycosyltransferase family 2 protein [Nitrososphaerota archaeon]